MKSVSWMAREGTFLGRKEPRTRTQTAHRQTLPAHSCLFARPAYHPSPLTSNRSSSFFPSLPSSVPSLPSILYEKKPNIEPKFIGRVRAPFATESN